MPISIPFRSETRAVDDMELIGRDRRWLEDIFHRCFTKIKNRSGFLLQGRRWKNKIEA